MQWWWCIAALLHTLLATFTHSLPGRDTQEHSQHVGTDCWRTHFCSYMVKGRQMEPTAERKEVGEWAQKMEEGWDEAQNEKRLKTNWPKMTKLWQHVLHLQKWGANRDIFHSGLCLTWTSSSLWGFHWLNKVGWVRCSECMLCDKNDCLFLLSSRSSHILMKWQARLSVMAIGMGTDVIFCLIWTMWTQNERAKNRSGGSASLSFRHDNLEWLNVLSFRSKTYFTAKDAQSPIKVAVPTISGVTASTKVKEG